MSSVKQVVTTVVAASQARMVAKHVSGTPVLLIGTNVDTGALVQKSFANEDLMNGWLCSPAGSIIVVDRVQSANAGSF